MGLQLRRLREAAGIDEAAAGNAIRVSAAKLRRLEMGRSPLSASDIGTLLTMYGIRDRQEREMFSSLGQHADDYGWWHRRLGDQPTWFQVPVLLERASSVIRVYEPQFVPELLQTEDCARSLIRVGAPNTLDRDADKRVARRMARQRLLAESGTPSLWAVIDEAALWRLGAPPVMRAQIERLLDLSRLPHITLQVMPFGSGGHAPPGGPFSILRFAEPDLPDIVHLEQLTGALYLDECHEIAHYTMVMDRCCVRAKSPPETDRFLDRIRREI